MTFSLNKKIIGFDFSQLQMVRSAGDLSLDYLIEENQTKENSENQISSKENEHRALTSLIIKATNDLMIARTVEQEAQKASQQIEFR